VKIIPSLLQVFQSRKMGALLLLGFASGLPFALTDDAFRAWLTKAQFDPRTIGWLGLVSLPYSLKFLWAPLVDRFVPPLLGRRRGWIVVTQVLLVLLIGALALQMSVMANLAPAERSQGLWVLSGLALTLAFLSATQDISIDAYRTDVVKVNEVGAGAATYVTGYRMALIVVGVVGFNLADRISWQGVYGLMAVLMGLGIATSFWAPEPERVETPPESLDKAVILPFQELWNRLGWRRLLMTLSFIVLYKVGDAMVGKMAVPFLGGKGLGFSDAEIGSIRQGVGLVATVVGTLTGGAILSQIGINRSLWVFGILQAVSNLGYYALALVGKDFLWFVAAINVENFSGGLGTAGFLGFLMSLCHPSFSATQFALLSSLMAVGRDLIASPVAGELVQGIQKLMQTDSPLGEIFWLAGFDRKGWGLFFLLTLVAALPGLILLPFFAPWNAKPALSLDPDDSGNDDY